MKQNPIQFSQSKQKVSIYFYIRLPGTSRTTSKYNVPKGPETISKWKGQSEFCVLQSRHEVLLWDLDLNRVLSNSEVRRETWDDFSLFQCPRVTNRGTPMVGGKYVRMGFPWSSPCPSGHDVKVEVSWN